VQRLATVGATANPALYCHCSEGEQVAGSGQLRLRLTIDECVENVLPVLLHKVVDVAENSAVEGQFWSGTGGS
jgi:hypothetical protein